jgi:hypothetical protein
MVLAFYEMPRSQTDIAKLLGVIDDGGVPASRVLRLASRKLSVKRQIGSKDDLLLALERGIPPILEVNTRQLPYWTTPSAHVVLLAAIDADTALVNDPAFEQPMTTPFAELQLAWDEMDNYFTLIERM